MLFRHELSYNAPPAAVYAMLIDPAFREEVSTAQGALRTYVTAVTDPGAQAQISIEQVLPTTGLPDIAKKFVSEEITLKRSDRWDDATTARVDISIPDKPGKLAAGLSLTADGQGTKQRIEGELTVSIPFIGAKLEAMVAELFSKALDTEGIVGGTWLTTPR